MLFHDVSSDKYLYYFREIVSTNLLAPIYHCNIVRNLVLLMDHKEHVPHIVYYQLGIKQEQLSLSFLESQRSNTLERLLSWISPSCFLDFAKRARRAVQRTLHQLFTSRTRFCLDPVVTFRRLYAISTKLGYTSKAK